MTTNINGQNVSVPEQPAFDGEQARAFLRRIFSGLPGVIHICEAGNWIGGRFDTTEDGIARAVDYAAGLDRAGASSIYFRTTTMRADAPGRGGARDTVAVPMLWADVDYGAEGHKATALPPDANEAHKIILAAELPEATEYVLSGGGIYPLYVLPEPLIVADVPDARAAAEQASKGVQLLLGQAHAVKGFHYGEGVDDLARVLRLPGSVNRKTDNPRRCRLVNYEGARLTEAEVSALIDAGRVARFVAPGAAGGYVTPTEPSVFDALAAHAAWSDLLEPHGWTFTGQGPDGEELWLRPGGSGDESSSGARHSARAGRCDVPTLVVHSTEAGLPTGAGQKLTKARVFALLNHEGSQSAAYHDLVVASLGIGGSDAAKGLPAEALAAIAEAAAIPPAAPTLEFVAELGTPGYVAPQPPRWLAPNPHNPTHVAEVLATCYAAGSHLGRQPTLRYIKESWWGWEGGRWREWSEKELSLALRWLLKRASYSNPKDTKDPIKKWNPVTGTLREAAAALESELQSYSVPPGTWFGPRPQGVSPHTQQCLNGLLDVATGQLHPPNPVLFNITACPVAFDPAAHPPTHWLEFLEQVYPGDPEAVALLQEWFGYALSGRTDMQKLICLVGTKRSGKGTILRLLAWLMGGEAPGGYVGIAANTLEGPFGGQNIAGRSLVGISDADTTNKKWTFGGNTTELLKRITGEDDVTLERKHREAWHGRSGARFVIVSNGVPSFNDPHGALLARTLLISHRVSFLNREDYGLEAKLKAEGIGILRWAVEGYARLTRVGQFTQPASSVELRADIESMGNPYQAFLDELCDVDLTGSVESPLWQSSAKLAEVYNQWALRGSRESEGQNKIIPQLRGLVGPARGIEGSEGGRRCRGLSHIGINPDKYRAWQAEGGSFYTGLGGENTGSTRAQHRLGDHREIHIAGGAGGLIPASTSAYGDSEAGVITPSTPLSTRATQARTTYAHTTQEQDKTHRARATMGQARVARGDLVPTAQNGHSPKINPEINSAVSPTAATADPNLIAALLAAKPANRDSGEN